MTLVQGTDFLFYKDPFIRSGELCLMFKDEPVVLIKGRILKPDSIARKIRSKFGTFMKVPRKLDTKETLWAVEPFGKAFEVRGCEITDLILSSLIEGSGIKQEWIKDTSEMISFSWEFDTDSIINLYEKCELPFKAFTGYKWKSHNSIRQLINRRVNIRTINPDWKGRIDPHVFFTKV